MKIKLYSMVILLSLLLMVVPASGAEKLTAIPTTWSNKLQASTTSVIQAGLATDDSILMTRAMIKARFEEQHIVQAQHIVAKTLEKNLPTEPVINKAYEGIAKQVPAVSVVQAMNRVRSRYEHAYALAGQLSQKKEVKDRFGYDLAAGLAAGLEKKDAEQLVNQLQTRAREMEQTQFLELASESLLTSRDMARQGVSSGTAAEVVSQAIQKEFSAQEMRSMRNTFMSQSTHNSTESLAKSYSNAIQEGKDPEESIGRSGGESSRGAGSGGDSNGGSSSGGDSNGGSSSGGDSSGGAGSGGDSNGGSSSGGDSSGGAGSGGSSNGGSSGSGAGGSNGAGPGH